VIHALCGLSSISDGVQGFGNVEAQTMSDIRTLDTPSTYKFMQHHLGMIPSNNLQFQLQGHQPCPWPIGAPLRKEADSTPRSTIFFIRLGTHPPVPLHDIVLHHTKCWPSQGSYIFRSTTIPLTPLAIRHRLFSLRHGAWEGARVVAWPITTSSVCSSYRPCHPRQCTAEIHWYYT
jgi:hypothetical protein